MVLTTIIHLKWQICIKLNTGGNEVEILMLKLLIFFSFFKYLKPVEGQLKIHWDRSKKYYILYQDIIYWLGTHNNLISTKPPLQTFRKFLVYYGANLFRSSFAPCGQSAALYFFTWLLFWKEGEKGLNVSRKGGEKSIKLLLWDITKHLSSLNRPLKSCCFD